MTPHLALTPGIRLGVYEVIANIGEGGMGQVFRARDTRLDRDVAIKALPEAFAHDADRLARFQREAKTLASLNHPNIAAIYGLEESGGMTALVMELVEGDDLSQRIARGAIPLDEALPIAKQIAEALEAAHEQGIIHRDLKPANIKVRADAMVKVLDFGLAKALDVGSDGSGAAGGPGALSMSPTVSLHATQAGLILGTAAYMSPEQAAGKPVDKRTDLWAFGAVVMEMLTGQPVFTGETVSHVFASVLKSDPDWTALPATTPAALRRLLRRCLEKERKRRLSDAADARLEIEEAMTAPMDAAADAGPDVSASPASAWRRALPWTVAAAFGVALVSALVLWSPWHAAPAPAPRQLIALIGADASLPTRPGRVGDSVAGRDCACPSTSAASGRATPYAGCRRDRRAPRRSRPRPDRPADTSVARTLHAAAVAIRPPPVSPA
jgi:serine/threonine protein kinase